MTYYCMHFENLLPIFIIKKLFAMHTRLIACFFVVCGFVQNNCFSSFPSEPGYILFKEQCRSRDQLASNEAIWICTVFHAATEFEAELAGIENSRKRSKYLF